MKKTLMAVFTLGVLVTGAYGIEVIQGDLKPQGCEPIAEIRAGDVFNRHSKDIARQSVIDDAEKLGAHKVSVELFTHVHPKLGKDYTARAIAYKCSK
ncbi:MAG: hypothetical protein JNJ69_09405 [Leptospiraceae bacterium]|nr:hypothetical protein [Leptospiraceae bacterium]